MHLKIANPTLSLLISLSSIGTAQAMESDLNLLRNPHLNLSSPRTAAEEKETVAQLFQEFKNIYTQEPQVFKDWAEIFYQYSDSLKFLNALKFTIEVTGLDSDDPNFKNNMSYLTEVSYDLEYAEFIKGVVPYYPSIEKIQFIDAKDYLKKVTSPNPFARKMQLNRKIEDIIPVIGKYADPNNLLSPLWLPMFNNKELEAQNPQLQGWKIHISAETVTAKKAAGIALHQFKEITRDTGKEVFYKLTMSVPHLRTLALYKYFKDQESQAGKFITIYPIDQDQAYLIATRLDQAFLAKQRDDKSSLPFKGSPLSNDAMVGHSGFVYTRYGKFEPKYNGQFEDDIRTITPKYTSRHYINYSKHKNPGFVEDNRLIPWPDFMNKGNKDWETAENPFKDLPLQWIQNGQPITWETRPYSWPKITPEQTKRSNS